jgi:hypothetical protein
LNIKYLELGNREWLYQKYITENLSTVKIGKIIGCYAGAVVHALNRHDIPTRSCSDAAHKGHKGFESDLLNDHAWLCKKYCEEKLNTYEIAKIACTNQHSVMCALKYHRVKTRSYTEAAKNRKSFWRKFHILENREWLFQNYTIDQKSSKDIAIEIGCSSVNVLRALSKFNIEKRNNSEAHLIIPRESSYELLNNPTLLNNLYTQSKLSTISIAEICGAKSCNSVRQFLIKHHINVRDYREAQIHSRVDDGFIPDKAVIDGGLLGDASLGIHNIGSDISMPYYVRKNKHREHISWVAKQLIKNNPENYICDEFNTLEGKKFKYYNLRTQSHDCLKEYIKRWYPEYNVYDPIRSYMKVIPDDVDISPLSLLHAFLDDGTTYRRRKDSLKKQVYAQLCFQGFPRDNLEMFCEKYKKEYGNDINIKTRPCYTGYGYLLEVSQSSYQKFMDIIGTCPEPLKEVFGYKWK